MMNGYEKPVTNKVLWCLFCEYTINISLNTDFFFFFFNPCLVETREFQTNFTFFSFCDKKSVIFNKKH